LPSTIGSGLPSAVSDLWLPMFPPSNSVFSHYLSLTTSEPLRRSYRHYSECNSIRIIFPIWIANSIISAYNKLDSIDSAFR
jgi:hypothetical protein